MEAAYDIHFSDYFASDLAKLAPLERDELVVLKVGAMEVTPRGRLLIRNICMCFDAYLHANFRQHQFSRVI